MPGLPILLFAVIPGVLAPILTFWMASRAEAKIRAARHWPIVRARIVESRINRNSKGGRWATVRYAYEVQGAQHQSTRLSFVQTNLTGEQADAVLTRYPSGAEIEARYDPDKPGYAVLEPTGDVRTLRFAGVFVGAAFLVVAVILVFAGA
ncbi:hypothetical protein KOAAANKH_03836 [Brevundimonas sp. NIBR10]|uniref:DUF3592 domain-containing protein n=1 Tax=Brevundimonas sp. NIBR10 TaxID=3015997 RepID=UPI0022F183B2|nr:DUF3592 domain-containing protein [Brevundimonas sp. NIBR10]WGM48922.1 hypothetical protein KOAAANKH_03836 [Brevundimonas sp. NIBR10]